jgi:hypothetical protein
MPTIGNTFLTLADLYKRQDADKQIATIIELLAQVNPILEDGIVQECNDGTKHLTTVRTGIPLPTWRKLYQAVKPTKSTTKQVHDTTGMLEAWSEVDAKLVDLSGNPGAFRLSEAQAFLEGMAQEMATGLFYHDTADDPSKFMGLAPRFNSLGAENGGQIVDAAGTGSDNTSIWFTVWGERTFHLLYPKGSKAGLQREDKGKQTKETSDGVFDVYREKFTWDIGASVRDWRYIVRIANIDVSDLTADGATGAKLIDLMITAYYKLHQRKIMGGKPAIYCNTKIKEFLHKQTLRSNSNTALRVKEVQGEEILTFLTMPIRECDALVNTEARVV